MTDQNKKGSDQEEKRNPERDQIKLFLEASLNTDIQEVNLTEQPVGKNNKIEGIRNKVFLYNNSTSSNQPPYKFSLGNFNLESLPQSTKINNDNNKDDKKDILTYKLFVGYVSWKGLWDINELNKAIISSSTEINPFKNKNIAFRYIINSNDSNKYGLLKPLTFDILINKTCIECKKRDTPNSHLIYCLNDRFYYCTECDKKRHEQNEKNSLNLHLRTKNFKYSMAYFGNCQEKEHFNKPYEYFDESKKECLCVKCVEALNSPDKVEKDIIFIEDYLKIKKVEEDFLNSRIDAVCEEINKRLLYAENIWKQIDEYENSYCTELENDKAKNIKKMYDEGFARQTYLCCIFMEIQRIIKEIDSKIIFIKNQKNNVDVSTYLYMNQIYLIYMQNELIANLDYLCSSNLEISTKNIITIDNKVDTNKFRKIELRPFENKNEDDYIMNDL